MLTSIRVAIPFRKQKWDKVDPRPDLLTLQFPTKSAHIEQEKKGLEGGNAPPLEIALAHSVETPSAHTKYSSKKESRTGPTSWQVSFVLYRFKPARRGHIPLVTTNMKQRTPKQNRLKNTLSVWYGHYITDRNISY